MSSSQPFLLSSQTSTSRTKSRFTYQQLKHLSNSTPGPSSPLRVIAHIDLDAFYAQCEQIRLGLSATQPLAVQQWSGLIAVNYAARAFGISRHAVITEAKKLCPELICQHVATWKAGDHRWAYRDEAEMKGAITKMKVSLDPYRLESKKIFTVIKDSLPAAPIQRVEKAGIDEVFLDLSAHVHQLLLERYPELQGPPPYDDPTENLPMPPTTALEWKADALVDLDKRETEDEDPDWDDVAILIGSEIVRDVRAAIKEKLGYTCSAGIARNKMMAKLGSGHKKPNQQTVVRNRAIQQFLSGFKFTKIRNLGGKFGEQIVSNFGTDALTDLLEVSADTMRSKFGPDTGNWLYGIIRGEDHTEVNPRMAIKSMLSAKSFRPTITTIQQAEMWLRIFAADIYARCVEEGVLENRRRPKTMNLHYRQGTQTRSRQLPMPSGKPISEVGLFELAKVLLGQVIGDGRTAWPCSNLSLSVGGFEDGVQGNKGIGGFLVRGEEAKAMMESHLKDIDSTDYEETNGTDAQSGPSKKRKVESSGPDIQRFFSKREDSSGGRSTPGEVETVQGSTEPSHRAQSHFPEQTPSEMFPTSPFSPSRDHQESILTYFCSDCRKEVPEIERDEHEDWHFAKTLQLQERQSEAAPGGHTRSTAPPETRGRNITGRGRGRGSGKALPERGQKKLAFG